MLISEVRARGSSTTPSPRFRYERDIFDKHVLYLKSRPPHETPKPSKFCETIVTLHRTSYCMIVAWRLFIEEYCIVFR